jgi:mono/diheme cytochrome c family protein
VSPTRLNPTAPCAVTRLLRSVALILLAGMLLSGCRQQEGPPPEHEAQPLPPTPADLVEGEQLFNANCASCHGMYGRGTELGPPLVHRIYEPAHHGDVAFHAAVRSGVIAHHWRFGNMPPVPHVTTEQVNAIIGYVRWMQREAGID